MYSGGSGLSQPEWRLPATSQQQQQQQQQHPGTTATTGSAAAGMSSSSSPQPSQAYNPGDFGPVSGAAPAANGVDTTAWGVRYNHPQHQAHSPPPPPLPPRPFGASDQGPARIHSPPGVSTSPVPNQSLPPAVAGPYGSHGSPGQHGAGAGAGAGAGFGSVPPPPPPLPPGYQSQGWQQQAPQGSTASVMGLGNSSNYSLVSSSAAQRPHPSLAVSTSFDPDVSPSNDNPVPPPVPPKTSSNVFTTSNPATGVISPSDWEYLGPSIADIDDTEIFTHKKSDTTSPPLAPAAAQPQSVSPTVHVSHAGDQPGTQIPVSTDSPVSSASGQMQQQQQQQYQQYQQYQQQQQHAPPPRVNTADSFQSRVSADDTTEKIDGAIEAWTRPISPDARAASASSSRQSSVARSRDQSVTRKPSPSPLKEGQAPDDVAGTDAAAPVVVQDPYEDLDPWFKSSLARYVAMLRKESVADSDEERYRIFTAFTVKETKLREILYGIEQEPKKNEETQDQKTPAAESGAGSQTSEIQAEPSVENVEEEEHAPSPIESGLIPVETELAADYDEDLDDGQYSPGGRPIIPRIDTPGTIQRPASQPPSHEPALRRTDTGAQGASQLRSCSVPPLTTNPPQRIYTPFQYTEGPQRGSDHLNFDRPAYEAYSDLRQASAESGRVMSNAPADGERRSSTNTRVSSPAIDEHNETFIGLIREKSVSYKRRNRRRTSSPPPLPLSLRQGKPDDPIAEIQALVSSPFAKQSESPWHTATRESLQQYPDDFGYIQEAIREWEVSAKSRRQGLDKERILRQEDSEAHVDSLFNGKEIGYADINVLEEEFRQAEARVQLDEERKELDLFIEQVFTPLDDRLDKEITALRSHYDSALGKLQQENSKAKDSATTTDKHNMSHTMQIVNDIHRKIELRYQKRVNIALDRERRRKKTERRPLVFMGDSLALKKLDADFDQMEKRNVLEAARGRDDRANRLMDPFDDAIIHGLGENQSLLDDVAAKMNKIETSHLDSTSTSLSESEIEQALRSVSSLVDSLRRDSESMLHNFGVADSTLNNADYRVSVAEARYSNADHDIFRRLDAEKKKEDAKIHHDLASKLHSIRIGPANITRKINELLEALGKPLVPEAPTDTASIIGANPFSSTVESLLLPSIPRPASAVSNISSKKPKEDAVHQQRIQRALEQAKKRNAAKAQGA